MFYFIFLDLKNRFWYLVDLNLVTWVIMDVLLRAFIWHFDDYFFNLRKYKSSHDDVPHIFVVWGKGNFWNHFHFLQWIQENIKQYLQITLMIIYAAQSAKINYNCQMSCLYLHKFEQGIYWTDYDFSTTIWLGKLRKAEKSSKFGSCCVINKSISKV